MGLGFKRASQSHKENHVQRPPRQYRETQNQIPPAKSHSVAVLGAARALSCPPEQEASRAIQAFLTISGRQVKGLSDV